MHLLQCLFFVEGCYRYQLQPVYINTHSNHPADDLSRDKLPTFRSKVPSADHPPTPTSHPLLVVLLDQEADWTSTLVPGIHKYFQHGLAPSTHMCYQAAIKGFYAFRSKYNVHTPFPLTEHILCPFGTSTDSKILPGSHPQHADLIGSTRP